MSSRFSRANAARFALHSFQWAKGEAITGDDAAVIDLLTDIRHYCEASGFSFADLDRLAAMHFEEECSPAFDERTP